MTELVEILHREQCSCVIFSRGEITLCHQRGVKDLYELLHSNTELLREASVADKVVGKGAAALMILGGIKELHADLISRSALTLLEKSGIPVGYDECVPYIINRAGTGRCPVETLCAEAATAEECLPLIREFIENQNNKI